MLMLLKWVRGAKAVALGCLVCRSGGRPSDRDIPIQADNGRDQMSLPMRHRCSDLVAATSTTFLRSSQLSRFSYHHLAAMSLLHALVARGTNVLAEHATGDTVLKPGPLHGPSCADHSRQDYDPVQDPAQQLEADL